MDFGGFGCVLVDFVVDFGGIWWICWVLVDFGVFCGGFGVFWWILVGFVDFGGFGWKTEQNSTNLEKTYLRAPFEHLRAPSSTFEHLRAPSSTLRAPFEHPSSTLEHSPILLDFRCFFLFLRFRFGF